MKLIKHSKQVSTFNENHVYEKSTTNGYMYTKSLLQMVTCIRKVYINYGDTFCYNVSLKERLYISPIFLSPFYARLHISDIDKLCTHMARIIIIAADMIDAPTIFLLTIRIRLRIQLWLETLCC